MRPPTPRYESTWSPDSLLEYLSRLYPLQDLDLEFLTYKLVTLLALTSASRVQTLSLIKIENITILQDKLKLEYLIRLRQTSQTISRWIKKTLLMRGIDTSRFTGQGVRHASTSAAYRAGVHIDKIKKMAGWTSSSNTFFKFYNRPLEEPNNFAEIILQLGN
nr:unnamed protein product [Callosobruchus analis]